MKRIVTILLLLVCAAAGAVRWLDVMYYTDLATGFVTWGSYLWRYALAGGVLVLLWLAGWMMPKTSASLKGQSTAQGLVALVCGVGFAALGGVYLAAFDQLGRFELALAVLYLVSGVWMLLLGRSRFTPEFEAPTGSALFGIAGTLALYLLTIKRFGLAPTGSVRVNTTREALAALAALLFCTAQLKTAYIPSCKSARGVWLSGMGAFALCTCLALPSTVWSWMQGQSELRSMVEGVCLALVGLMGAVYAFTVSGEKKRV